MLQSNNKNDNKLNYKFSLFKGENDLSELVNKICEQNLDDKLCVVSVIGKSDLDSNSCKAELIDESLKKNIFKDCLFKDKLIDDQILNEIEGYYDIQNKVIFLHLISPMDTDQMIKVLHKLNRKLKERGFLDIWSDLNLNTIKSILLLFLISHIIVIVQPSIQIDINFLQIFRLIEKVRTRTQISISDLLKEIPELNKSWINSGRPCSPRVLFVFESYHLMDEQLNKHLNDNKRKYEEYLEDQLYRFLRRSRIITNLCSNALFAICNQNDFVFISTKQNSIRDTNEFFNELLHYFCDQTIDKHSIITTNLCNELISENENQFNINNNNLISSSKSTTIINASTTTNTNNNTNDERSFFDFLFIHIKTALTKGFDDNIGRHNQPPVFELPKLSTFSKIILTLKDFFFKQLNESRNLEFISDKLKFSLDTDNMFSETRCSKILPISISYYREKLPSNYTQEIHEQKLNQTLQFFKSQVRGLSVHKFIKLLEQDCDQFWRCGHQVCGMVSLFNNHCMNPIHRTKSNQNNLDNDEDDDEFNENNNLKIMEHNSNIKYISTCNCGYRQCSRDDPYSIKQANNDFYYNLSMKCNCNELTSFEFPIFEGSIETARPALLNRFMHNLNLNDDYSFSDSIDGSSYEEIEEKLNNDENLDLVDKLQTQLESQPLDNLSQEDQNKLSFDLNFVRKDAKITNDIDLKDELNDLNEHHKKSIEQNTDQESTTTSSTVSSFNENDLELLQKNHKKAKNKINSLKETEFSKTEYLNGMLNNRSPKNLLPLFNSWSLVCLGSSSIYSHNLGVQNQPGFLLNCNFLLPWDVVVKIEHSGDLPKIWTNKKLPGIKNKKVLQDGTQFTVKIFVGMEYECLKGHRFMCSKPNTVLKAQYNHIKETANQLVSSDMPLFMPCICSLNKDEELAQLMRIHVVTPKAPVFVTLNPRIQISTLPCPIFYPMNINENKPEEMIKLTQSAYWMLRLPFVYQQMINSPITKIYSPSVNCGTFLKDWIGICQYLAVK